MAAPIGGDRAETSLTIPFNVRALLTSSVAVDQRLENQLMMIAAFRDNVYLLR